jgi:hypothetical protein
LKRLLFCLCVCLLLAPGDTLPSRPGQEAPEFETVVDDGSVLPSHEEMTRLAKENPIAFLRWGLVRLDREVQGYRVVFRKHEKVRGRQLEPEVIDAAFRAEPFSVRFEWKQGATRASRVLYVAGENNDSLVVRPTGLASFVGLVERDVKGAGALESSRYPITEFGIKVGMQRTLSAMIEAKKEGALRVEYLGEWEVPELGGRRCWVLRRTGYKVPEEDGITELTIYVDQQTWLQTGSLLRGPQNAFIADYFFGDIEFNPKFPEQTFVRDGLR